jgi:hypothetical protein
MCNTHGHRVNNDVLEAKGSGFVAHHHPDFMLANDKWFKGVSVQYGPAGDVYLIDWSDVGECHDYDVTDREHGRIYRIAYRGTSAVHADLADAPDEQLVAMQTSTNEWSARHARTILRDRGLQGPVRAALQRMFDEDADPIHRLRAMWTLHTCGGVGESRLIKALADPDAYVRAWAIQLLAEDKHPSAAVLARFTSLAAVDPSPVVRLYLASALQRIPVAERATILDALLAHAEDADDANLPQMYWYAAEPLVATDRAWAVATLGKTKIAKVRELIARRLATR